MKKRMINKGIASVGTVAFIALIRPEQMPPMWAVATLAISFYEIGLMMCRTAKRQAKTERRRHYVTVSRENGRRWANTRIGWPMKEVI